MPYNALNPSRLRTISLLALLLLSMGCGKDQTTSVGVQDNSPNPFKNLNAQYLGDASCTSCHEDLVRSYQSHGMAKSMYRLNAANAIEDFSGVVVRDEKKDLSYRVYREGDRFFQEEFRTEGGQKVHSLVREMKWVVGSGNAARTYLTEENGRFYELPVTWYTQNKEWAFSPGYADRNGRFGRVIPERCMACHNSYPTAIENVDGKYANMPGGISCERCHGPGSLHVEERTADPDFKGTDYTIVNPKHLSLDKRLDVCQQCHLHAPVSLKREGQSAFGFRPSQVLSSHVALFQKDQAASDQIPVISHADRMKQSACFRSTQNTPKAMDCVTCHNPHEGYREKGAAYFNQTCISCHPTNALTSKIPASAQKDHQPASNCISCHMPRTVAKDAPHASFTDHLVRIVRTGKVAYQEDLAEDVRLKPVFPDPSPEAKVYEGMAYLFFGRRQENENAIVRGIEILKQALPQFPKMGEALYALGYILYERGEIEAAIPWMEKAVAATPNHPERLNGLAQAYEAAGRDAGDAERLYQKALQIQPAAANIRTNYGRLLEKQQRFAEALAAYQASVREDPWQAEAHYNLGTLYQRQNQPTEAERYLREAVRLNPDYVSALGNLGVLLARKGQQAEAERLFRHALKTDPNNPTALGNMASFYLSSNRFAEAVVLLEKGVQGAPNNAGMMASLAAVYYQLGRRNEAKTWAQKALRLDPNQSLARQVMGAP